MKDFYKILEVSPSATFEEIKKSYRRLAFKYHPDRNSGNKEYQTIFIDINEAYKILSNKESRKQYDITYKIKLSRVSQTITPQLFLSKFQDVRKFIFTKGRRKISESALHKALDKLLSDTNIKYLQSKNNIQINEQIINEVLLCCSFLIEADKTKIISKLVILAGTDNKLLNIIYKYERKHKTKYKFITLLATITHKVTQIFH